MSVFPRDSKASDQYHPEGKGTEKLKACVDHFLYLITGQGNQSTSDYTFQEASEYKSITAADSHTVFIKSRSFNHIKLLKINTNTWVLESQWE